MRFRQILRLIGILNAFLGIFMLAPLLVSLIYSDGSFLPILYSFIITSGGGLLLFLVTQTSLAMKGRKSRAEKPTRSP